MKTAFLLNKTFFTKILFICTVCKTLFLAFSGLLSLLPYVVVFSYVRLKFYTLPQKQGFVYSLTAE